MSGRTRSGVSTTSYPNAVTVPDVGIRRVDAIRRNVVLPAPFRPSKAMRSPFRKARDTPRSASTPGPVRPRYTFRTSWARRTSSVMRRSKPAARIKLDSVGGSHRLRFESGMFALLEHSERGLALRFFLRLAHLDDHRAGPDVAERILELPVPLAPELVLERHRRLRARVDRLIPELVDVLRVDVHVRGGPARGGRRLRVAAGELVGHHHERVADLDHRVHQGAVRHRLPRDFFRAERLLVELDCLSCPVDHEVRRYGVHPGRDGGRPCGSRRSRGLLLSLSGSLRLACHEGLPSSSEDARALKDASGLCGQGLTVRAKGP